MSIDSSTCFRVLVQSYRHVNRRVETVDRVDQSVVTDSVADCINVRLLDDDDVDDKNDNDSVGFVSELRKLRSNVKIAFPTTNAGITGRDL